MKDISLKIMIESGAHFGHQVRRWNPKMKRFIYGAKEGVHIFDLTKTKVELEKALDVLKKASKDGKKIMFVGTKKQVKDKIKEVALATSSFYVNERWLGGTLTNFSQVKKSVNKLDDMKEKMQKGEYRSFTKKERLLLEREIQRLERFFSGLTGIEKIPDLIVVVDIHREIGAVKEAKAQGVETIGIVDTNSDPTLVDYPIPMNDDATRANDYVLDLMAQAILEGKGFKSKKKVKAASKAKSSKKSIKKSLKKGTSSDKLKKSKVTRKKSVKTKKNK